MMSGGRFLCTPDWNRDADSSDKCFKMYAPLSGSARLLIDGKCHVIEAGNIYFISGFMLNRHECDHEMDLYWVHFSPQSLHLRYVLDHADSFHCWNSAEAPFTPKSLEIIPRLFNDSGSDRPTLRIDHPDSDTCRVQSILLYMLADLLKNPVMIDYSFERLEAAINFMNANYRETPSLKEIAQKSNLAPNYFHRLFKKMFGTTPQNYMTRRRMDEARQLLSTTQLSVKEVADHTGYDNEFYFSRTFKKHINVSPSHFREMAGIA